MLAHKFRVQASSLLQDKARGARWAGVVLVKAALEQGGRPVLEAVGPWARTILGLLGKPEAPATKRLAVVTLTRIFGLTQGQQSLAREITTPLLPGFVTACLNNVTLPGSAPASPKIDSTNPLLGTILQALIKLLPHHPASFRPFVSKLRTLLLPLLAPTPSHVPDRAHQGDLVHNPPDTISALAQRLFCLLPVCAPKNGSSEEWLRSLNLVLASVHDTADYVFRAVRESEMPKRPNQPRTQTYDGTMSYYVEDDLRLPGWGGIHAGAERLAGLLQLLQAHIASTTAAEVLLPLDTTFAALNRVLLVFEPVKIRGVEANILNLEVSRDEREGLWSCLPAIHVAAIDTIWTIVQRVGLLSMSFASDVLEHMCWVFEREQSFVNVRQSIYRVIDRMLQLIGPSMTKAQVSMLNSVLSKACSDFLPVAVEEQSKSGNAQKSNGVNADNADSYLKPASDKPFDARTQKQGSVQANSLVLTGLKKLPSESIPKEVRRELDRAVILSQDHEALLASVLNPPVGSSQAPAPSLIPFLALTEPAALGTEALLRPRMPFFRGSGAENDLEDGAESDKILRANGFAQHMDVDFNSGVETEIPQTQNGQNFELRPSTTSMPETQSVSFDLDPRPAEPLAALASPKRKRDDQGASIVVEEHSEKRKRLVEDEQAPEDAYATNTIGTSVGRDRTGFMMAKPPETQELEGPASRAKEIKASDAAFAMPDMPFMAHHDDSDSGSSIPSINPDPSDEEDDEDGSNIEEDQKSDS